MYRTVFTVLNCYKAKLKKFLNKERGIPVGKHDFNAVRVAVWKYKKNFIFFLRFHSYIFLLVFLPFSATACDKELKDKKFNLCAVLGIQIVFGSPGSGTCSSSTRCGSGSGSLYNQAKIVRKTLIPTVLWLFLWLFIFEKLCKCSFKK
jgi:hypothetical protein